MSLLEAALKYAKSGKRVFPCNREKRPLIKEWQIKATSDEQQIRQWWSQYDDASIGCACGPESGIWVLDIDLPHGPDSLRDLQEEYGPLPTTRIQETGSGGTQYFWQWNGREIRNSASKVARDIDVRGNGGYVILPPSLHPSGKTYRWIAEERAERAPDWLIDLVTKEEPVAADWHPSRIDVNDRYGAAALAAEITSLSHATEGSRNDSLNKSAYSLGQLVGGGCLDEAAVVSGLLGAALMAGLKEHEARKTIESGIKSGKCKPRTAPEKDDDGYYWETEGTKQLSRNKQTAEKLSELSRNKQNKAGTKQELSRTKQDSSCNTRSVTYSLSANIQDWVLSSGGCFTTEQLDREFCLTTRREKNNRSQVLFKMESNNYIKKDKRQKGKWIVIDPHVDWVDLDADEPDAFPVNLPFEIHQYCKIPPKAIIALAGSSNAGKTAFILNTLRLNLNMDYKKLYLMSEMGSGEYKDRLRGFGDDLNRWKKIKAASKSYDFDGTIKHFNADGLTCIDFLEEVDGEYFKIASSIRDIYDSLRNGIAIIAIQKKTNEQYGRGGQATAEKARLYMTLDYIATEEHSIVCALKMVKVKHFLKRNLQNHEIHFRVSRGCQIEQLTEWMPSRRVNREIYAARYEATDEDPEVLFNTDKGTVQVVAKDLNEWQRNFPNINVRKELERIAERSMKTPFLKKDGYFFQLAGILRKKNQGYK